jgi:hypothetical protein
VAGDFDGDGHADIYAVQNSYAPIPAVGRFDGGLSQLLDGDGHGGFTVVGEDDSKLTVPGDGKALAILDLDQDGWADFVISHNNSTTLAFRNRGERGRHSFGVKLVGPSGNPNAIGASVSAMYKDGSTQTSEVSCGVSYYSQSSANCFFGYSDLNPVVRLKVRWPTGAVSEEVFSPHSPLLILSAAPP